MRGRVDAPYQCETREAPVAFTGEVREPGGGAQVLSPAARRAGDARGLENLELSPLAPLASWTACVDMADLGACNMLAVVADESPVPTRFAEDAEQFCVEGTPAPGAGSPGGGGYPAAAGSPGGGRNPAAAGSPAAWPRKQRENKRDRKWQGSMKATMDARSARAGPPDETAGGEWLTFVKPAPAERGQGGAQPPAWVGGRSPRALGDPRPVRHSVRIRRDSGQFQRVTITRPDGRGFAGGRRVAAPAAGAEGQGPVEELGPAAPAGESARREPHTPVTFEQYDEVRGATARGEPRGVAGASSSAGDAGLGCAREPSPISVGGAVVGESVAAPTDADAAPSAEEGRKAGAAAAGSGKPPTRPPAKKEVGNASGKLGARTRVVRGGGLVRGN
jgi:hypothetical protein